MTQKHDNTDIVKWLLMEADLAARTPEPWRKLVEAAAEIERLRAACAKSHETEADLLERIRNASMILMDWDGYYDPKTHTGSVQGLADVIEDAYKAMQGESWRKK